MVDNKILCGTKLLLYVHSLISSVWMPYKERKYLYIVKMEDDV